MKKESGSAGAEAAGGQWSSEYLVTVENDGEVAGTSKPVTDVPSVPAGFTLEGVEVDGASVDLQDGSFVIAPEGVKLAAGEKKQFTVVLSGSYEAGKADWAAAGKCEVTGEGDPTKGFFNKVVMNEDSDGPENNDACNPV
ncbi:hypothetical protein, partial [Dermabacter hominis]|uniref:hypothetical protein n=1 Tax=Dermabacter hominis TaxID=36740 RepID=UPI0021A2E494